MNLSKRLYTVASMVTKGNITADVGTDHGYVAMYLVEQGISPFAFAMDINKGPLERAKEHIAEAGLEDRIMLIQSDGMKELKGHRVDTAIVAGMGGMLICKILDESPVLNELKEIVVSPHSDVDKVRRTLFEKGFRITDEKMVEDYGKYYNIIKARNDEELEAYTNWDYKFGKLLFKNKDEVFYEYLGKLQKKYIDIIELLNKNESNISKRNYELRKMLKDCEKAISKWNS